MTLARLREVARLVRAKNAGPFWLTIDIFCPDAESYERIARELDSRAVAHRLATPHNLLKRFDIPSLNVVKFSLPRPEVQGTIRDRDLHGAAIAEVIAAMEV